MFIERSALEVIKESQGSFGGLETTGILDMVKGNIP